MYDELTGEVVLGHYGLHKTIDPLPLERKFEAYKNELDDTNKELVSIGYDKKIQMIQALKPQ